MSNQKPPGSPEFVTVKHHAERVIRKLNDRGIIDWPEERWQFIQLVDLVHEGMRHYHRAQIRKETLTRPQESAKL